MSSKGGVDISAVRGNTGLIKVTLAGQTDDIAITFKITDEEARKLVKVLEDQIKR